MTLSELEISRLVDQAAEGRESAVRELLTSQRPQLLLFVALRMDKNLRQRMDPSDVVQDVFTEAIPRLPEYFAQRPLPFHAWLRRLAWDDLVRLYEEHVLAQKRSVTREVTGHLGVSDESMQQLAEHLSNSTPSQYAMRNELKCRVHQALHQLTDDDRELLVMKHLENLTLAEIAATLNVTMAAVKGRHLRALRRMAERLGEMGAEP